MKMFIGVLSTGKGTWGQVSHIIDNTDYTDVYLISNDWAKDIFKCTKEIKWIIIDHRKGFPEIVSEIESQMPKEINNLEINIHSGSGKEHTALLSILLKNKIKFKLVTNSAGEIIRF